MESDVATGGLPGPERLSTGMPGLDAVIQGLHAGDNVVWEVDTLDDYLPVLEPLAGEARRLGRRFVYFRFARHAPLFAAGAGREIHELDPQAGFERFLSGILDRIEATGRGAYYVFDCLSDLAADWLSDRMLGNFFMIACPYLHELDTIAYFALLKHEHSFHATDCINRTSQVVLELFRKEERRYLHPLKVWRRYSPTLYMLHSWEGAAFRPVTRSATITDILGAVPKPWLEFTIHRPGIWVRTFQRAQQMAQALERGEAVGREAGELFEDLLRMVVTRDERLSRLAREYFDLRAVVEIMQRMIGTGQIGGKSLGMLLARAILLRSDPAWAGRLESHDSFYVGSDVFYTYLVQNGCWWLRRRARDFEVHLERAEEARRRILTGTFPDFIRDQFLEVIEYFGQSPLIVRSSSLLEDNYGNAFSGKYESVFCVNQGTPEERLAAFMAAVRTVYASALSEEGLRYRLQHELLDHDEQMALLVQRVSGEMHGHLFLPQVAGVGFSFNPYVWHEDIDPAAGVLRLVFGLGTRAVDRTGDDYTRLVALNAPGKRVESSPEEVREFAQRRVDGLDLRANRMVSPESGTVAGLLPEAVRGWFFPDDGSGAGGAPWMLDFERVLGETRFVPAMRALCATLQEAYDYPVDIEFTANFEADGSFRVNVVQCRPFQVTLRGQGSRIQFPEDLDPADVLFQSRGPVVGQSLATVIDRLIYVVPAVYGRMSMTQRYSIARTIGRLTHLETAGVRPIVLLLGPGRWGTSTPSLGVPVSFAEIDTVSVLVEMTVMHEGLVPDVSLGTHFFNDLVEMDMLYLAISPGREGHHLREDLLRRHPNQLVRLLPSAEPLADALWVIDSDPPGPAGGRLLLNVDAMGQRALCYREPVV
ncbi:MAG: pyruvate, phosphate dikinase [Verrucomicrobiae bacterium]|nr:pyruvate, phosphate dikinase [Verrucomicrobiae bacterium]